MSILAVNLKHLYQKRSFWFLGLFFGAIAFGIIGVTIKAATRNKLSAFSGPVLWIFFVSVFIASLPIEVLTRPFSSCLPDHNKAPRKFLFSVGLVLSFLWSLVFLFYPDLDIAATVLVCVSAFSTFTISHWLGAWFVSKFKNWSVIFAIWPLIMLGNGLFDLNTIVVHAIVQSPLPMILLGSIVNFLAWNYWGRADLSRRYCGRLWMGTFDAWNKEKMSKFKQARLAEKDEKKTDSMRITSGVEDFFISRISRAETASLPQYIWGAMYKSFGTTVSQYRQDWMRFLIFMVPIVLFLCYMPGPSKNIIFVMPGLMVVQMSLRVYSSLLICGGRQQRFWSALTLAAATGILVTIAVMALAIATNLLEGVMPQLTVKGHEFTFDAVGMNYSLIPFMMIPITFTIGLIFHKKPMLAFLFVMIVFQILFAMSIVSELTVMNTKVLIEQRHIIIMLLCAWAMFIAVLRYISMRCCLAGQGK
jgi:hypothetical protein